jgi:phage repressor protein C with HTH and peptisase S24 domain
MRVRARGFNEAFGRFVQGRRQASGETQIRFAARAGVSSSYLAQIEQGVIPPMERVRCMVQSLGEDLAEWLAAAGYALPEGVSEASTPYPARPSDGLIPVVGEAKAASAVNPEQISGEWFPVLDDHAERADAGVARVQGYSMSPGLLPGDYIGLSATRQPVKGDIVLARRGEESLLKRFVGRRGRRLRLESDNPAYPRVEADDIEIIGVVVWSHRDHR